MDLQVNFVTWQGITYDIASVREAEYNARHPLFDMAQV
jgi:hypothetical protein